VPTPTVNRFGVTESPAPSAPQPIPAAHPSLAYATAGAPAPPYLPPAPYLPPVPFQPAARPAPANGMLDRRAWTLVAIAISIGAVGMAVSWLLGRNDQLEPETYIRYAIVLTIGIYAIVGGLLVTQLTPAVKLTWRIGNPVTGVLLGVAIGGGLGLFMLAAISGISGHLSSDPRVVAIMSEGDVAHIGIALLLTVVCAPLVEEVLFRGLLLESLRTRGTAAAIWLSGLAFSVWHLTPSALRYYALMGALFGLLYTKRGLVCSMAAHATFNGVLGVAALAIVLAPAKPVFGNGISLQAPGGWSQATSTMWDLSLHGPSGSWFGVESESMTTPPSLQLISDRLESADASSFLPGYSISVSGNRIVNLPAGRAVEVDVVALGHRGNLVLFPRAHRLVEIVFMSGGSLKAETDFGKMLQSVHFDN